MSKFVCHKCNTEKTIANYRVRVVNNKTVVKKLYVVKNTWSL